MRVCGGCQVGYDIEEDACPACGWLAKKAGNVEICAPGVDEDQGYDPQFYASLYDLEGKHFWFRNRNALILRFARRYFSDSHAYLEVGCGTGFVLSAVAQAFPRWRVWGAEVFSEGLRYASERVPTARFLQMDARRIPFRNEFSLIGCFDVLEHIEEDGQVLASMREALKPAGGVLLTVPQHPSLWSQQDVVAHHVRRYERNELQQKLAAAGFEILSSTSFVTTLLPVMAVSRSLGKLSRALREDQLRELRPGRLGSLVGEIGMRVDRLLISMGVPLPVGGSRLVAARRID